jgi:hypothetical protein
MKNQLSDTNPEIEKIQISLIRELKIFDRISLLNSLSQTVINLSRKAIARANPGLNEKDLNYKFVKYHYGEDIAERLKAHMTE